MQISTWNVRLSAGSTLKQRPAVSGLQPDLVCQLGNGVLGGVARVHVYSLGAPVQEEEPADDGAESLHGRDLHRGGRQLARRGLGAVAVVQTPLDVLQAAAWDRHLQLQETHEVLQ